MKIQKITIKKHKNYESYNKSLYLGQNFLKLDSEFNLKNIEIFLDFIELNIEYCIHTMDMCSRVHDSTGFKFTNKKYKSEIIYLIYCIMYKTIYDTEGIVRTNFKDFDDNKPSKIVCFRIMKKINSIS